MAKFALRHIEQVKGKVAFYFLEIDGINQYEKECNKLESEGNYHSEIVTMQVRMQEMAEMRFPMPVSKCRDITPKGSKNKEYELKTKNLRCYLFHEEKEGRVIVMLSKKHPKSQNKDIRRFRRIKDDYLNQTKS